MGEGMQIVLLDNHCMEWSSSWWNSGFF